MKEVTDLLLTMGVLMFLAAFFFLWIYNEESKIPMKTKVQKHWKALIRTTKTKVPVFCEMHAREYIVRKGKLALLADQDCEICNKKSRVV